MSSLADFFDEIGGCAATDDYLDDSSPPNYKKLYTEYIREFTQNLFEVIKNHAEGTRQFDKFLTEGEEKTEVITHKITAPVALIELYCYVFTKIVEKDYDIVETCSDNREPSYGPAENTDVEIALDVYASIWHEGYLNLRNKKTQEKLAIEINPRGSHPYINIKGLKHNKELIKFKDKFNKMLIKWDFYRNKTLIYKSGGLSFIKPKEITKNDVILDDKVWKILELNVLNIFKKNEEYKKHNIPTKRGVILEGPPGNGKSLVVKYINSELNEKATIVYITDGALYNGARSITHVFELARKYKPCILIFEDVDSIGETRDRGSSPLTSELLSQLDGLENLEDFVIIATTNYAEKIDDALKNRPSRFDRRIKIDLPSDSARFAILKNALTKKGYNISDEELQKLKTSGFSGAELEEVVITAQMEAMHNKESLNLQHLTNATAFLRQNYHDNKRLKEAKDVGFRQ